MKKYIKPELAFELFYLEDVLSASSMNNKDVIGDDIDWGEDW